MMNFHTIQSKNIDLNNIKKYPNNNIKISK